ncbi:DUF4142 domain-containing protein [Hyphomicrobium sp.]|uniref:DUF4142 domain-containing protein n=1 Tax=Hyphomicrobium sp. TaxID=82 RepID=UPI002E34B522|nr:DUF4142 domain-containing protein [Hyphomicrobium sp.]HEX2840529.1 DUF4142 domain-containing protein [Hyphomicrobium sp.]
MKLMLAVLAAFAVLVTGASAVDIPKKTRDFIDKATVANKFEIDTSKLAQKFGQNAEVKTFADQMIADHTKAGQDFHAALKEASIEPPSEMLDAAHMAKYVKLRVFTTERGFDSAYVDEQLGAHEQAIDLFKDYAATGPTPALKDFASKTLPTLEHHLAMIKDIDKNLRQESAATGASTGNAGRQ